MAKERVQKQVPAKQEEKTVEDVEPKSQEELDAIKAETDALLDEIDSVLEVNAEEFVKSYIQKGGQ